MTEMIDKISKKAELFANIGLILITIIGSYVLIRYYLFNPSQIARGRPTAYRRVPAPGQKVSIAGVNWAEGKGQRSLILVLSSACKFCKESAPFYQRIVQETKPIKDVRLMAVLPQNEKQSRDYLNDLGVAIEEVKQGTPESIGTSGFPTLILADNSGTVKNAWVGKLAPDRELEVINQLKCVNCR